MPPIVIRMVPVKQTKNTYRFEAPEGSEPAAITGGLYIQQEVFGYALPRCIEVTITVTP